MKMDIRVFTLDTTSLVTVSRTLSDLHNSGEIVLGYRLIEYQCIDDNVVNLLYVILKKN